MPNEFTLPHPFQLESGEQLPSISLAYQTWGTLNKAGDNVIWVCHALTGNSDAPDWWPNLIGPGLPLDTDRYFIVCANNPGSCYGSTGPLSINPKTEEPWYHDFPLPTTLDMAKAFDNLRVHLGIHKIQLSIGGSMGGQIVLSWAVLAPSIFERIVPVATNASHSPWGIAFNEAQRMAIEADPSWKERNPQAGLTGMRAARATAMLSYRHYIAFAQKQPDTDHHKTDGYRAASYLQYMGDKLTARFDAFSYWVLSKAMDSHHVGRGYSGAEEALSKITAKALVIGVNTDILFPPAEQEFIASHIPESRLEIISSDYGHDGFLVETEKIGGLVGEFLEE